MKTEMKDKFVEVFGVEPIEKRLMAVITFLGEEKVGKALDYLMITGLRPIAEGKRDNPYGLVYSVARWINKYKFEN